VRRVKCDETRPGCLRCKKFGRECDGYASDQANSRRNSLVPLKPRPTCQTISAPAFSLPEDEQERRYYELFCDRTAADLAGYYPTDFWKRIALQEGHSEPAITHAVVALGALTKCIHESGSEAFSMIMPRSSASEEHHEYALSQYNRAIVELRHALAKGKPQIRTALIACLLFVCFENFHGDYEAAARHMQCGLSLLEQWQATNPRGYIADPYSEEVFQIFARYNAQSAQHIGAAGTSNPSPKLFYWESIGKRVVPIPLIFANVHEARMCWDVLQERCIDYHKTSSTYKYTMEQPNWIIDEADACALQLQQFEDAFWPLLSQPGDGHSLIDSGAIILYLCNKISAIQLQVSVVRGECHWDDFKQHFEEIIARATKVVERSRVSCIGQPGPFAFELGIIPPLHLCAMKCREPRLRRRAIALLLSYPRREGCWDGVQLGKVDTWIMQLEEEGMDEFGHIPEESRWRLGEIKANIQERWIWAKLIQDSYNIHGQWTYSTAVREHKITT
jgi:Fungal specific transcription factor domain/Fungal Zn(2)-Cys(6) binuclear cluster domain